MKRLEVLKTYKLYIGGQFPRTESGRYYQPEVKGKKLGNICLSSRKDFRNAVVAARNAQEGWNAKSAYNRSQIIYRIAEILEGRKAQFIAELMLQGSTKAAAEKEVCYAIDRIVYFAGWCDKYQQIFSSVNPVASSHFNFSVLEPMGVVSIIAPQENNLIGLITAIIPAICGGNTVVVLVSEKLPLCAITFAEVLNSSDVPGGVVNILTGKVSELYTHFATHMDVNAIVHYLNDKNLIKEIDTLAVNNIKRVIRYDSMNWFDNSVCESPYFIESLQEVKTTWHPIEKISASGSAY